MPERTVVGQTRDILAQKVGVPQKKLETILEVGKLAETGKTKAERDKEEKERKLQEYLSKYSQEKNNMPYPLRSLRGINPDRPIKCCPRCNSFRVMKSTRRHETGKRYRCVCCGWQGDEPGTRKRKQLLKTQKVA